MQNVLLSSLAEELHGKALRIETPRDKGSFLQAYAQAHQRLSRQFEIALSEVEAMETKRRMENWDVSTDGGPQRAADAMQDLVYRATEVFDFYHKDIPEFLARDSGRAWKSYESSLKHVRSTWAMICNRCKHNHRFLVPVEARYEDGENVTGFSVYGYNGSHAAPDQYVHVESHAFSYNLILRKLFAAVTQADVIAGAFVKQLPDRPNLPKVVAATYFLPYSAVVDRLLSRSDRPMPDESRWPTLTKRVKGTEGVVEINLDSLPDIRDPALLRMWIHLFGDTLTFSEPYTGDVKDAAFPHQDLVEYRPHGKFIRLAASEIRYTPR